MKPLFGNLFDLDGNGRVSPEEELFGYTMMKKIQKGKNKDFDRDELDESDELDDDYDDSF